MNCDDNFVFIDKTILNEAETGFGKMDRSI